MLRSFLFFCLLGIGVYYSLQGPFYGLLLYIGNAYFRPEEWVWGDGVRSLPLSFIIGLYVVIASCFSRDRFVVNRRVVLLWLFLCLSLFSSISSEHFDWSWPWLKDFMKVIVMTYLLVVLTTDFAKFRLVILIMVLALGIGQAKQGWIYLIESPGWPNTNPLPFLGDNNGIAVGMLMLCPLVGLLAQTTQNARAKNFYQFLFIGCLYRALSTYSRGGFLAGLAMGGVWWLRSQHKLRGLIATLLVLSVVLPALPHKFWDRMRTIQTYEDEQEESALSRLHFWAVAMDMAAANPILGAGFNSYNKAYDAYDFSNGQYGKERSVHSSFFGVLAELGYVGILLYGAILFSAFRACAQVRKFAAQHGEEAALGKSAIALETSLSAFVVGGSFVAFQYNEMLWHMIGLTMVLKQLVVKHERQNLSVEQRGDQSLFFLPKPPIAA
jgi:probable O-glycosylation ligase (exosortase A-associated)